MLYLNGFEFWHYFHWDTVHFTRIYELSDTAHVHILFSPSNNNRPPNNAIT